MLDGTHLKRHFSDIVSASATKSGSDIKLIDPFQLINWKDKTPPDHLYPKFKPFLQEFKEGISTKVPRITDENSENNEIQEVPQQEIPNSETTEQRSQATDKHEAPTGINLVIKKLMDTTMAPDPLDVPDSLANSKRPKNKRKVKETKGPSKPQYHIPIQNPQNPNQSKKQKEAEKEPETQKHKKETKHQPYPPKQRSQKLMCHRKQSKEANIENTEAKENTLQTEDTTSQLRRSRRLPKASAKYLESIRAKLQGSDSE